MRCTRDPRDPKTIVCENCKAVNLEEEGKCNECGMPLIPIKATEINPDWVKEENK